MTCTLCGHRFEIAEGKAVCNRCTWIGRCEMVKCPQCGFELVPEAKRSENRESQNGCKRLTDAQSGEDLTIAALDLTDPVALKKLLAIGALPGTHLELVRTSPAYVFRLEGSQFAIDRELAFLIQVKKR